MAEDMVDIAGLDKAHVLTALYNSSGPQGMGWMQWHEGQMSVEDARAIIAHTPDLDFDYVMGRSMKINLSTDAPSFWLYDRDNGKGSARRIIGQLRAAMATKEEPVNG